MMKWRNLKTDPPRSGTDILLRRVYRDGTDIIESGWRYRERIRRYIADGIPRYGYLVRNRKQWQLHLSDADLYYITITELKNLDK